MRIALYGYYGKGNWGDDLLMLISCRILRERFVDAHITIVTDSGQAGYILALLNDEDVTVSPLGYLGHFDLVVHGGGGVFFDYKPASIANRCIEIFARCIGFRAYLKLVMLARRLIKRPLTTSTWRIAMGVGVGSFCFGSPAFRRRLELMRHMNAIWVRDQKSCDRLARFGSAFKGRIVEGSDLVFLTEYWRPKFTKETAAKNNQKPKLGVVWRDGPNPDMEQMAHIKEQLLKLRTQYDICVFIFEEKSDTATYKAFEPFKRVLWNPYQITYEDYSHQLALQDVVLTSRAHGAICAACLGVPSVIVEIEPKLRSIHAMLPAASVLVGERDYAHWPNAIADALALKPALIADDMARNRKQSQAALQQLFEEVL